MSKFFKYACLLIIAGILPSLHSLSQTTGSGKKSTETSDTIFYPDWEHNDSAWIDFTRMPEFPGGEEALLNYIKSNTSYPLSAIKDHIEGRVIIKCVIDTEGRTDKISTLRNVRSDLDSTCIRVIKNLPKFKPGSDIAWAKKGYYMHNINVWYMFGIYFSLYKNDNEKGVVIHPK